MEADWTVALAGDDPRITVPWASDNVDACRFVDLRHGLDCIDEIEEARKKPQLRNALLLLNGAASQLWTSKCDAWDVCAGEDEEAIDRYEMDAELGEAAFGSGSYIDLLPRDASQLSSFERQQRWIRVVVERLRGLPLRAARVELVLRHAEVEGAPGFGVSWFAEGCGATAQAAAQRSDRALAVALAVILETPL